MRTPDEVQADLTRAQERAHALGTRIPELRTELRTSEEELLDLEGRQGWNSRSGRIGQLRTELEEATHADRDARLKLVRWIEPPRKGFERGPITWGDCRVDVIDKSTIHVTQIETGHIFEISRKNGEIRKNERNFHGKADVAATIARHKEKP